jgi:hypothetical protein
MKALLLHLTLLEELLSEETYICKAGAGLSNNCKIRSGLIN